jgi:hypothetical protein
MDQESEDSQRPQDVLGSIEFSFKYPFTNKESKYGPVLIGALMVLGSILILPIFTFNGYLFKMKEYASTGKKEAPKFNDWGKLTKEGFLAFIALLPLFAFLFVGLFIGDTIGGTIGALVVLVTYLIVIPASPVVGVVYSVKRDIVSTYTDSEVYDILFSIEFLLAILKYFLLAILLFFIYLFGAIVTLGIGVLVLMPVFAYVRPCFWSHLYYRKIYKKNN